MYNIMPELTADSVVSLDYILKQAVKEAHEAL